ncbi:metallophosphoesterase [Candidatus Saccharibacteria bacterium]|nr:metallophosphoesterase [Candidatus Saccharibacteria bacterium]
MSKEPNTLKVRLTRIHLSRDLPPVKVMLTGDWHISPIVSERQEKFLTEAISKTHPDVIIVQGDLIDSPIELQRETSLKKLMRELKLCAKAAPTAVVLGNHDYITPINPIEVRKEYSIPRFKALCKKCGVHLLLDEWLELEHIRIFGAFQNEGSLIKKTKNGRYIYYENPRVFQDEVAKLDFSNLQPDKINWFAAHAPFFTPKVVEMLQNFDVLSFGHTHGGIVPRGMDETFEKLHIHGGLYSAGRRPFPRKVRGSWKEKQGSYVIINSGMVGMQFCAPRVLQKMNFIKAAEVNLAEISSKIEHQETKEESTEEEE